MFIEEYYIERLCSQFRNFKKVRPGLYNFSCPHCGDSRKHKRKARGYIYKKRDIYLYTCHNCGYYCTLTNLIKQFDEKLYRDYIFEKFKEAKITSYNDKTITKKEDIKIKNSVEKLEEISTKIIKLNENHKAVVYLKNRMIPEVWFYKLFYIDNFSKISHVFEKYKDIKLPTDERILIPLINKDNKLYGVMARSLDPKSKLRYVTIKEDNEPTIFNINNINYDKTIYVLEGAFDSMFIPNSLAVASSNLKSIETLLDKDKCILIFDSQYRNKEIVNTIESAINEGYTVSLLPEFDNNIKDINEWVIQNNGDVKDLLEIINKNIYSGLMARIKLSGLRKI